MAAVAIAARDGDPALTPFQALDGAAPAGSISERLALRLADFYREAAVFRGGAPAAAAQCRAASHAGVGTSESSSPSRIVPPGDSHFEPATVREGASVPPAERSDGADDPSDVMESSSSGDPSEAMGRERPPLCLARRTAALCNLGNTCFMNSALQCLANVPRMRDHFLISSATDALFTSNCAGSCSTKDCRLASGFAALIGALWDDRNDKIAPLDFINLIQTLTDRFTGHEQHDSMEFIEYLLDGLRTDLNNCGNCVRSPCMQGGVHEQEDDAVLKAARQVFSQSDSVIDDLFVGFSETGLTCPHTSCGHKWAVADPILSVRLPSETPRKNKTTSFVVTVLPCASSGVPPTAQCITVDLSGSIGYIIEVLVTRTRICRARCILLQISGGIAKIFDDMESIEVIQARHPLLLYELTDTVTVELFHAASERQRHGARGNAPEDLEEKRICPDDGNEYTFSELISSFQGQYSEDDLRGYWRDAMAPLAVSLPLGAQCVAVVHCRQKCRTGGRELVGFPLLFCTERNTTISNLVGVIRLELTRKYGVGSATGWRLFHGSAGWDASKADTLLCCEADNNTSQLSLREYEHLIADWEGGAPEPVAVALTRQRVEPEVVTLETCFEWLTEPEVLEDDNAVMCSGCGQKVQALAQVSLAMLPPVLVVQLKRFRYSDGRRYRLSTPVAIPLEGLDLGRFCHPRYLQRTHLRGAIVAERCSEEEEGCKPGGLCCEGWWDAKMLPAPCYDLVAVSVHWGAAAAGHYVAYVRSAEDGLWRLFDDDEVFEVSPEDVQADLTGAYILFYIRRDHRPSTWGPLSVAAVVTTDKGTIADVPLGT